MNERDAFLRVLAANEDDTWARLVYADWLDDRGEHEEADRQRKWPAAKEWLVRLCKEHGESPWAEDPYNRVISYEYLIEAGRAAVKSGHWIECGNNELMCNALRENRQEFLKNWSVLTGEPLPAGVEEKVRFSCAC